MSRPVRTFLIAIALVLMVAACHDLGTGDAVDGIGPGRDTPGAIAGGKDIPSTAKVELIRDGQPASEIVIANNANQGLKLAAEDLRKHLELISGANLPVVNRPTPGVKTQIYIGESEFTGKLGFKPVRFENSGFEIVAKDHYVILAGLDQQRRISPYQMSREDSHYLDGSVITGKVYPKPKSFPSPGLKAWQDFCGEKFTTMHLNNAVGLFNTPLGIYTNDDLCSWYAVAELLEQLGVRWYMPYEDGTVIPAMKTIAIPEQHLRKEAKFYRREWCYYNAMRDDGQGVAWLKRLKAGNRILILYNHTQYAIYSSYEQQTLHPEYLACDADGKPYPGYPSGRGMPRFTNPGFRQAAVTYMNKVFDAYPDLAAMTVGPPDGGVKLDARDLPLYGKPTDPIAQKAANYAWDFHVFLAAELKKSHPDKYLLYMPGNGARGLPTNIEKFPDNLTLTFPQPYSAYLVLDSLRRSEYAKRQEWFAAMRKGGLPQIPPCAVWDYFLYYRYPSFPRYPVVFTASLQEQMKEILPYANGKFIEIQFEKQVDNKGQEHRRLGEPGLIHLMVYWQNKLFWEPDLDRKKLLTEYYRLFFGPAEAEMREFYEFAEQIWTRQDSRSLTETTGFLKEKDVDKYFEILARAHAKAGAGTVYARRVALIEKEMTSLKKLFPNLKRSGPKVRAHILRSEAKIDGVLDEHVKGGASLVDRASGKPPRKNPTRVQFSFTPNKSALIVGVVCPETRMDKLKADCVTNDDAGIFDDDVVEVYVNTPERSYFKVVVNPGGAIWDETTDVTLIERDTLPLLWNPGVTAGVKKYPDRWVAEILIPTKDFGQLGPTKEYPWGIQVGRTRFAGGTKETWALARTDGPYATLNHWGDLWLK